MPPPPSPPCDCRCHPSSRPRMPRAAYAFAGSAPTGQQPCAPNSHARGRPSGPRMPDPRLPVNNHARTTAMCEAGARAPACRILTYQSTTMRTQQPCMRQALAPPHASLCRRSTTMHAAYASAGSAPVGQQPCAPPTPPLDLCLPVNNHAPDAGGFSWKALQGEAQQGGSRQTISPDLPPPPHIPLPVLFDQSHCRSA
jgi:hypothetical protein